LTLSILMVPYATLLIPLYVLLNAVGLSNSLVGVALMIAMFQLPFATYMMRISFEATARAGRIGADRRLSSFGVLWRIMLPSVTPGLVTVERFLRAADPVDRPHEAAAARGGGQPAPADHATTAPPKQASW
jgi:multiple sugar transport system permease protein